VADTVTIPAQGAGTTTPVIATDDLSGVHYQKINRGGGIAAASNVGSQVAVDNGAGGDVVLASNASRRGFSIIPNGDIYLSFGGTPTSSSYLLPAWTPFNMLEGLIYTGAITGLAPSATAILVYVLEF
jgi:hypothetical protein